MTPTPWGILASLTGREPGKGKRTGVSTSPNIWPLHGCVSIKNVLVFWRLRGKVPLQNCSFCLSNISWALALAGLHTKDLKARIRTWCLPSGDSQSRKVDMSKQLKCTWISVPAEGWTWSPDTQMGATNSAREGCQYPGDQDGALEHSQLKANYGERKYRTGWPILATWMVTVGHVGAWKFGCS